MAAPTTSPLMDQNYRESERHIDSTDHYLNQVSRANLWGGVPPPPGAPVNRIYRTDGKTKLFCCVNLYQIDTVGLSVSMDAHHLRWTTAALAAHSVLRAACVPRSHIGPMLAFARRCARRDDWARWSHGYVHDSVCVCVCVCVEWSDGTRMRAAGAYTAWHSSPCTTPHHAAARPRRPSSAAPRRHLTPARKCDRAPRSRRVPAPGPRRSMAPTRSSKPRSGST